MSDLKLHSHINRGRFVSIGMSIAIAVAAVGISLLPAAPASAATPTCYSNGTSVTDNHGRSYLARYCSNWLKAPIYSNNFMPQSVVGYMYAGTNWVACWKTGTENPTTTNANGTVNRNTKWLWTQGDVAAPGFESYWAVSHGWNWMPVTYVAQGSNYQAPPGVPQCTWT